MKNILLSIFILLLSACSSEEVMTSALQEIESGIQMTISDFVWDSGSRTTLTSTANGVSFAWTDGDQVAVYAASSMANFDVKSIRQDARSAVFDGGGFGLTEGSVYHAFYPYNAWSTNKTAIMLAYTGQAQVSNDDISNLSSYDFMVSRTVASGPNMADFHFSHVGAIMKFQINLPAPGVYTQFKVVSSKTPFIHVGLMDLTAESPTITPIQSSNEMVLTLGENGFTLTEDQLQLVVYLVTPPVNLSEDELSLTVSDNQNNVYSYKVKGKNMLAGFAYGYFVEDPSTFGSYNGHDYVDMGLPSGTLWATCNLGAENPTDFGKYYAWGETRAYGEEDTSNLHNYQTDGKYVKTRYSCETYKYSTGESALSYSKYTIDDEIYREYSSYIKIAWYDSENQFIGDGISRLSDEDDAARVNWGEGWSMPTKEQFKELIDNCVISVYKEGNPYFNGIGGYKLKSKKNGNSLFFPSAGTRSGEYHRTYSYYLTENIGNYTGNAAVFSGGGISSQSRYVGCSIRPVRE